MMIDYDTFKDDLPQYRSNFIHYRDLVLEKVSNETYRYRRYSLEFGCMLIYASEPLDFEICANMVRQTDNVYMLEENLMLVVFENVNAEQALKAAQNVLHTYQNWYPKKKFYASVAPIEQEETAIDIASRLFIILEYAVKYSIINDVVDMGQMRI
ncbi:MAG: hypothetical protein R3302_01965 [Sulfurimonadaceae bacterium]|nr:hypothetical protein [Sulfurimonadaceae bacterium]